MKCEGGKCSSRKRGCSSWCFVEDQCTRKKEKLGTKMAWEDKILEHKKNVAAGGSQELGRGWINVVRDFPVNQLQNRSPYSSCTLQVRCPQQVRQKLHFLHTLLVGSGGFMVKHRFVAHYVQGSWYLNFI